MAAILPSLIAVDVELLTAARTSEIVDGLSLYLVKMAVPPFVPALVTAKALFLPLGDLMNLPSTVLADSSLAGERKGRFSSHIPVDVVPSAERLHCVQRYAECLGNLAVTVACGAEFDDL